MAPLNAGADAPAYAGFWMAGYEGADHVNGHGVALDMVRSSGHLDRLDEDHRRAAQSGIRCVRESIGWRLSEDAGGAIDLDRALRVQASARRHGLQVLWTLMHYGLPPGLSLHDDAMIPRLARFAAEVARALAKGARQDEPAPVYTPVNEIGFLAWAASQPGMLAPPNNRPASGDAIAAGESSRVSGYDVKRRLARASIAAMEAIRGVTAHARFLHVEPVVHVVAPRGRDDLQGLADLVGSWQWQAWDLLCGKADPAIGGRPEWLDLVGLNHYHSSQWEVETEARLDWHGRDPRRRPMREMLAMAWDRYRRPLLVAETSHVGAGRAAWLHEIASEVRQARDAGVPVDGICLYPAVDRPDWAEPGHWHRSGLWHVESRPGRALARRAEPEVHAALRAWQRALPAPALPHPLRQHAPRVLLAFSHLRWGFVRHRARHLLQALADEPHGWRIVFVEEPLHADAPRLDRVAQGPQLDVLVPLTPLPYPGFAGAQRDAVQALIAPWLAAQGVERPVVWIGTAMAWPLARALGAARTVFDCADELGAFLGAPAELAALEADALAQADLVVCASAALAAPRAAAAGSRLRLLPNGVDRSRFAPRAPPSAGVVGSPTAPAGWDADEAGVVARAFGSDRWWRRDVAVLGYAGVVDERFDTALLAALADARPQWQFVIVGPVVKIAPTALPQRANVHWFGEQPYRLLPHWMRRWQVSLLPFAQHAATAHAQPLKVLEALAVGLPVVATRLSEIEPWAAAGVVCVAAGPDAVARFVDACEGLLAETVEQRGKRLRVSTALLKQRDWRTLATRLSSWLAAPALHLVEDVGLPDAEPSGTDNEAPPTLRAAAR